MWDDQTHPFSQWVLHGAQRCVCFWGGLVSSSLEKMQCLFPQSSWTWPGLLSKYFPPKPAVKPAWRHAHFSWEQPQDADRNTRVCTIDKNSHFFQPQRETAILLCMGGNEEWIQFGTKERYDQRKDISLHH